MGLSVKYFNLIDLVSIYRVTVSVAPFGPAYIITLSLPYTFYPRARQEKGGSPSCSNLSLSSLFRFCSRREAGFEMQQTRKLRVTLVAAQLLNLAALIVKTMQPQEMPSAEKTLAVRRMQLCTK